MKENDVELIQRTLEGDEGAFTAIVKKYQKWVHTLVWRKIGDFHIAEEITQDIFLKVYKKLPTLKPPDHFPGWLYVIATRHCISWLRKKQLPTVSLDAMPAVELEELCYAKYEMARGEEASVEQQRELVKRLLQKLPESERTVVTLYYLAEMKSEEISAFLGVSPNTVRSRLRRARERLEKQEHLLHDVSGVFRVPPTLTENILREIPYLKPTSPSASKPWLPWGISFASTFLVILLMGFGTRALSRFQQPYNLDATSEMTVELVDASVVLDLERKRDRLTRFGSADRFGKDNGAGHQAESLLLAAAQVDAVDPSVAKPQWIQTKGPGGISRAGLFLASDQTLYAIAKTGLYRLTEAADAWTLVSASGPNREFNRVMAERDGALYLLTPNELLVSVDAGETWNSLGARPEGQAVALIITDTAMYLVLRTEVFRSEDVGNQWDPIGAALQVDDVAEMDKPKFSILSALAVDNTLFVGTSYGLFRWTDDWEKLPVPTAHGIKSLAIAEGTLYLGTVAHPPHGQHAAVFYSTDFGDSWTNITPDTHEYPVKLIAAVNVVPVGKTLLLIGAGGILLSHDRGETWIDPGGPDRTFERVFGGFPTIVSDGKIYIAYPAGIMRSTDSGVTWHPFMAGLLNSYVPSLVTVKNVLYALTPNETLKSVNGGETWKSVAAVIEKASLGGTQAKIVRANDVLYASNSDRHDGVTLFRLDGPGHVFFPVEGVPDFEEGTFDAEWFERWEKRMEAKGDNADIDEVVDEVKGHFEADRHRAFEEWKTNGTFTVADGTVFMEYRHKLYRWRRGETAWHNTGLEDIEGISPIAGKGFTLAASGNIVYAGKREGDLFLSEDGGDTWRDITANLTFPFGYFKEILFAGSTVYVSTDMGVMRSRDGETWDVVPDADGNRLIMDRIAVDGVTAYGVCDSGVYEVDHQTNAWKQIIPELPYPATSFAVDADIFYIGTKQNGVLRCQRNDP